MLDFLKVEGNDSLIRDTKTKAIINNNATDYENYLKLSNVNKNRNSEIERQSKELNNIKEEINSIKQMLLSLLNK